MADGVKKIKPIGEYIFVQPQKEEEKTASGLIVQTSTKERPQKGKILALGTGRLNDKGEKVPFNVKVGDTVYFKKYSFEEVEVDGEEYLLLKESDILAVLAA